ncbi:MAG: hypothetical protein ABJA98_26895 [Acidobacteriota bacterium]
MTLEWIAWIALIVVVAAIGDLHHQAKRSAASLVEISVTLDQIRDHLSGIDSDITAIRKTVDPKAVPSDW